MGKAFQAEESSEKMAFGGGGDPSVLLRAEHGGGKEGVETLHMPLEIHLLLLLPKDSQLPPQGPGQRGELNLNRDQGSP